MTRSDELVAGSLFAGEFRVLRTLGQGAMGSVYAVEQWRTGHQRALKIMQATMVGDSRMRARFLQEAKVGARIKSDHVVHVVAAGIEPESGLPWIAMELLEGQSLSSLLEERGALPVEEAREIFAQLCHAVDAAHEAGVVHRDLKPGNIFLAASRREGVPFTVKVLDFGIAKLVAEAGARITQPQRRPTAPLGTPSWMAPEQAEPGGDVSPSTDVWALGLIAFALLVGRPFWRGLITPIPAPSVRATQLGAAHLLPAGFDGWFARCVCMDPNQRFQRVRDARAAFEALLPAIDPRSTPSPSRREMRSRPSIPSIPPPRTDEPTRRVTPVKRPSSTSMRRVRPILLIDDGPADQLIVGHILSAAGHAVISASTGEDGLRKAAEIRPALVLLDFLLPDIDAPEVLRRLRAEPATRDLPVILLTGTDLAAHIAEGFRAGANDYLMKPVDGQRLLERIEAALTVRDMAQRVSVAAEIEHRHGRLLADLEEARVEQELTLAALPAKWTGFWAVGGVAQSGHVGGDLFAMYEGASGARTIAAVDVCGHGPAAALVGASVRAALALLLRNHDLAGALRALNDELCAQAAARHACVALVRVDGHKVEVVNAGMPPIVVARSGDPMRLIGPGGVPPGLLLDQEYICESFELAPGDRIALVSDGLVEPFGVADDPLPVLAEIGAFDERRWIGNERPADVAERLRVMLSGVRQPDDAMFLLLNARQPDR